MPCFIGGRRSKTPTRLSFPRFALQMTQTSEPNLAKAITGNLNLSRRRTSMNNQTVSIRQAVSTDIYKLAQLHVTTWNATYPDELHKPTSEIREYQWAQAFED